MSQPKSPAGVGLEGSLPEPDVGNDTLDEIECEVKAVEEFMEGIREEKRDVTTAIQNLFFFCQALLRDVCRWRDRRQNRAGHKESSGLKKPAEKECAEAVGETSALSELTAKVQDINVKEDEGQEEGHSSEDQGSKEESDSGTVKWEDDDDIEGEEGEEVNLQEDSLLVDKTIFDIEDVVEELRGSLPPVLDDDDAEMPVEFLQSLVVLVRKELTAAEEEREMLERHEKTLTEEIEALNESRTSLLNASACERTDGSLNVPVDAEAESRGHEGVDEQAPTTGENPIDPSTAGESCEDATCALQTTEKEEATLCVRHEAPPAVGEAAGEATCLLEPEGKANPTLAVSQDLSRAEDIAYVAAQTERN